MEEENHHIAQEIEDAVMERPYGFSVEGRRFYLYPVSLGKSILLSRLMQGLEIDVESLARNASLEALRVVAAHKAVACRIIAYTTAKDKDEVLDSELIDSRLSFFSDNLSDDEIAQLLLIIYQYDKTSSFIKHLGLDREQREQSKIARLKNKNGNSVMFGGKSVYGSLISVACEKYGWTLDYVVWGISFVNLRMMLADSVTSIYLTDEEKKSARITTGQEIVNMDNPDNWAKVKAMKWD